MGLSLGLGLGISKKDVLDTVFTPASLTGISYWFKFNTNIGLGTGDEVNTWDAKYGDERFTVDSGKVLKNNGDLNFDTNNGRMTLNSLWNPGTFSFYFVGKITNETISNEEIFQSDTSNFFRLNSATQVRVRIGDTTNNNITLPGTEIGGEFFVIGIEWDGTKISIYQDSEYVNPAVATDTDTFAGIKTIGKRGNPFDGHIREIVMVDQPLSASDRNKLMTHLISVRDI